MLGRRGLSIGSVDGVLALTDDPAKEGERWSWSQLCQAPLLRRVDATTLCMAAPALGWGSPALPQQPSYAMCQGCYKWGG